MTNDDLLKAIDARLSGLATRDDLSGLASKDDLSGLATKDELRNVVQGIEKSLSQTAQRVEDIYRLLTNEDGVELPARDLVATQGEHGDRLDALEDYLSPQGFRRPEVA